jgi:general secretion pathway protein L
MPTSPTDPEAGGGTLLRFADGGAELLVPTPGPARAALAVPGTEVAIHWLDLAGDLTPAQAAAAARLMLADASAEPLGDMHVAAGRVENGLTAVALAPVASMQAWLADGLDPDLIVPESLLLLPPAEGLIRRGLDHRGLAQAFSVEPELAALVAGDAAVEEIGDAEFEAGLAAALAEPVVNLRQGVFAKRRQWNVDKGSARRIALLAAALVAVSLILQIATIMRYAFDADRMEQEAASLGPGTASSRPNFDLLAPILFEAVRSTPNLQLTRLEYRPDGSLGATVQVDSPATLAAFRARAEASGAVTEGGTLQSSGGQQSAEIVLRPA